METDRSAARRVVSGAYPSAAASSADHDVAPPASRPSGSASQATDLWVAPTTPRMPAPSARPAASSKEDPSSSATAKVSRVSPGRHGYGDVAVHDVVSCGGLRS